MSALPKTVELRLPTFSAVPADVGSVVDDVLRIAGPSLEDLCRALHIEPRPYPFGTGTGTQALLVPLLEGGFIALVVDRAIHDDPVEARFFVGHEAAHALFYDRTKAPPRRVAPWPPGSVEETFCDDFATQLLAREDAPTDRLWSWKR